MTRAQRISLLLVVPLFVAGCFESEITLRPPCGLRLVNPAVDLTERSSVPGEKVDVLFVVDNSGSMSQEQDLLVQQLPQLVRVLATGDLDGDSLQDFAPIADLHVGTVTTDMGVGGFPGIPTCSGGVGGAMFGDDGVLRTEGHTASVGCGSSYDPYLSFVPGDHPTDLIAAANDFAFNVGCVARAGTTGCGFESQLEAPLKALTPATNSTIEFFGPTFGHGDRENAGFLRDDSLIAIFLLSDEEDCSVQADRTDVYNQSSVVYTGDLNLRCFNFPDVAWPVQRYIDGFLALRPGEPERVVFGAIVGIPPDLATTSDFDAILDDPRMVERVRTDGSMAGRQLAPACESARGEGFPGRRIVEVARGLAPNSAVGSICQDDFTVLVNLIVQAASQVTAHACLDDWLTRVAGLVPCDVTVALPPVASGMPVTTCDQLPGWDGVTQTAVDDHNECRLTQLGVTFPAGAGRAESGEGWYYDDFSHRTRASCTEAEFAQAVALQGMQIPAGATASMECEARFEGSVGTPPVSGLGSECVSGASCEDERFNTLYCESSTGTCQLGCTSDAECPSGLVCDISASHPTPFCTDPVCVR